MAAHSMVRLGQPMTASFGLVLGMLAHAVGWPVARGGSGRVAAALEAEARSLGVEIETGRRIDAMSELPPARAVLLDLTPRQVLEIAGSRLSGGYRRALARYRYGPGVFKIDWALDGPIPWRDRRTLRAGTVHLGGPMREVAASEDAIGRGMAVDRPFVLLVQPTVADPSRAPAGKHVAWAYCHVPPGSALDMTAAIEDQVERFAPGFRDLVLARSTRTIRRPWRHTTRTTSAGTSTAGSRTPASCCSDRSLAGTRTRRRIDRCSCARHRHRPAAGCTA